MVKERRYDRNRFTYLGVRTEERGAPERIERYERYERRPRSFHSTCFEIDKKLWSISPETVGI